MARKPRLYGETGIYHIILRGNNQQNIFYDDNDRLFFLSRVTKYFKELEIPLYAYCLMGNHVHLLIGKGNELMPLLIKKITCSYVYYFNHKYERTGHLFQGRYKSEPVECLDYFKSVYRYILKNPEKAKICSFRKYYWSSYNTIITKKTPVDSKFINNIFESYTKLELFLSQSDNSEYMENIGYHSISQDDLITIFINQLFGINNPIKINSNDIELTKSRLHLLKQIGLSINMISRISGINKKIIREA